MNLEEKTMNSNGIKEPQEIKELVNNSSTAVLVVFNLLLVISIVCFSDSLIHIFFSSNFKVCS